MATLGPWLSARLGDKEELELHSTEYSGSSVLSALLEFVLFPVFRIPNFKPKGK